MLQPQDLFSPGHYEEQRRPYLKARTLHGWCYTSQEFYQRERERIFLRTWLFAGREDQIPAGGDFMCVPTPAGSVVVLRDDQGEVRAHANSCRHRGSRLLAGIGNIRRIVCPYHGWTYGLDGRLRGAARMDSTVGFDRGALGLAPLRVGTWEGFIWVSFNAQIEDLHTYFGDLFERFASYRFSQMTVTRTSEYDIPCNWKLLVDNSQEDYHTGVVHGTTLGAQLGTSVTTQGAWESNFIPSETSIAILPGEDTPLPHVPDLAEELRGGTHFTLLYPNTQFACVQDCMWWLTIVPLGPGRCLNRLGFCFPKSSVERPEFDAAVARYYHRWDVSVDEDNATGELQQEGLESALHQPGPYSDRERVVHRFANWVLDRVLD